MQKYHFKKDKHIFKDYLIYLECISDPCDKGSQIIDLLFFELEIRVRRKIFNLINYYTSLKKKVK